MNEIAKKRTERTKWYLNDRFGMFIHWGLYSIPARGEWVRSIEKISNEAYQTYFNEFNPTEFNPKEWAKIAKEAGMKYAVLTAKHHDGFCLFDSKLTDYKSTNTLARRDLVREYIDAFRAEGLKIGLYYSLLDWHHPDYPAYGDRIHPMRDNEAYKDKEKDKVFDNYIEYFHGQVKELLTNYGQIDIMWFDFSYDNMSGEKWQATKLVKMMRELQPDIIIDNRLLVNNDESIVDGGMKSENPLPISGDFYSPEQIIPPYPIKNEIGDILPWESCITLNNHWGYCSTDHDYKSAKLIIRSLVECVSKSGNFLVNVGPDSKGRIPEESIEILKTIGKWIERNGASIYGCEISTQSKPDWGRYTQKGNLLYAHVFERGIGPLNLRGISTKVKKVRLLTDGSEIVIKKPWNTTEYPDDLFIDFSSNELPDEIDTVIELEL